VLCCVIFQNQCESGSVVNGYDDEALLFDPSLITNVDWSCRKATFRADISPHKPGPNLIMRPLCVDDFDKGPFLHYNNILCRDVSTDLSTEFYVKCKLKAY